MAGHGDSLGLQDELLCSGMGSQKVDVAATCLHSLRYLCLYVHTHVYTEAGGFSNQEADHNVFLGV